MTYTIKSAHWGNDERTSAVIVTDEAAAVAISERDTPKDWVQFQGWAAKNDVAAVPSIAQPTKQQKFDRLMSSLGMTAAEFKSSLG